MAPTANAIWGIQRGVASFAVETSLKVYDCQASRVADVFLVASLVLVWVVRVLAAFFLLWWWLWWVRIRIRCF